MFKPLQKRAFMNIANLLKMLGTNQRSVIIPARNATAFGWWCIPCCVFSAKDIITTVVHFPKVCFFTVYQADHDHLSMNLSWPVFDDHLSSLIVKTSKQNKFLNVTRINGWVFYTSSTSTIWCQKHPFSGWCFNWMTPNHSQWKMGVSPIPSMNQKTVALGNYTALNLGKWHDQCTEPPTNGQVIFCLSLSLPTLLLTNHISSWWLNQHMWKICSSKWVHLPEVGVKNTKNLWNHHLAT